MIIAQLGIPLSLVLLTIILVASASFFAYEFYLTITCLTKEKSVSNWFSPSFDLESSQSESVKLQLKKLERRISTIDDQVASQKNVVKKIIEEFSG